MSFDAGAAALLQQFMARFQGGALAAKEFDAGHVEGQQDAAARAIYRLSLQPDGETFLVYLFDMTINRAAWNGGNILEAVAQGLRREGQNDIMGHIRLLILHGKKLEEKDDERREQQSGSGPAGRRRRGG